MGLVATGQITIVDANDSPSFDLSASSLALAAGSTGLVSSYSGAQTQFKVREAGLETTGNWSYFVSGSGGGVTYRDSDDTADRSAIGFADGGLGGVNLLPYSQQFDNAAWSNNAVAVFANATAAPDGTITAAKIAKSSATSFHFLSQTAPIGAVVASVYFKAAELTTATIFLTQGGNNGATFDLSTGVATPIGTGNSAYMLAVSGGWYRCVLCQSDNGVSGVRFGPGDGSIASSLGDGTSGVYIWGAQLESGISPAEYVPSCTTFTGRTSTGTYYDSTGLLKTAAAGEARYSYNPANLSAGPALLLEAAATNVLPYSSTPNLWSPFLEGTGTASISVVADAVYGSVVRITKTAGATGDRVGLGVGFSGLTGSSYAPSIVCKTNVAGSTGSSTYVDAQKVGGGLVTIATPVSGTVGVWARAYATAFGALVGTGNFYVLLSGPVGSSIDIAMPQLESGLFATSYIATTSTAATRAADTSTSTGQSGTRGLLNITGLTQDNSYLDITARKIGSSDVTKRLSLVRTRKGDSGPSIAISATAQGFTFLDGVAAPAQQYIGFQVTRYATTDAVQWYASNGATLLTDQNQLPMLGHVLGLPGVGSGDIAFMSAAQFGSAKQVVITAVAAGLSATCVVFRIAETTAQAGATRGSLIKAATTAAAWSDADANAAVLAQVGSAAQPGDMVTLTYVAANWAQTRILSSALTWTVVTAVFGGDVIVDKTIKANHLAAKSIAVGSAAIEDGAITNAMIGDATIDTAKIANLNVDKINAGSFKVGQYMQSTSYMPGSAGWCINADGTAELSNVVVRGTVYATDGKFTGEVEAVGAGGSSGDKARMYYGNFEVYRTVPGVGQVLYKALSRSESGVGANNVRVTIPGYFRTQPKVVVSPASLQLYAAAYAGQDQSITVQAQDLTESFSGSMVWSFLPVATLNLAGNTGTKVVNEASGTVMASWTSASYTTPANTQNITPSVTLASNRGNGASQFFYRTVRWKVQYYNGTSWVDGGYTTVALGPSSSASVVSTGAHTFPSSSAWVFRIYCEAYDTDGSLFGDIAYEYATDTPSRSDAIQIYASAFGFNQSDTKTLNYSVAYSLPSGWSAASYSTMFVYSYDLNVSGFGTGSITGSGISYYSTANPQVGSLLSRTVALSSLNFTATAGGTSTGGGNAKLTLHSATMTVSRRRPIANSTTAANSFLFGSYSHTLTSAAVLAQGTLSWAAVGD